MTCTPVRLVLDSPDPAGAAAFWTALLADPAAGSPGRPCPVELAFQPVPALPPGPRVHLDLATAGLPQQRALVAAALALGARPADIGRHEVPWVVLAAPDGTLCCVREPRPEYHDTGPVGAVLVDAADPGRLAGFWTAALGWPVARTGPRLAALRAPGRPGPWLELWQAAEPKAHRNPVRVDLAGGPGERGRLLAAGARALADDGLADPEGNEFRLLETGRRTSAGDVETA